MLTQKQRILDVVAGKQVDKIPSARASTSGKTTISPMTHCPKNTRDGHRRTS